MSSRGCFCGRPNNKQGMIQCRLCTAWSHFICVNVADVDEAVKRRNTFICPPCVENNAVGGHDAIGEEADVSWDSGNDEANLSNFTAMQRTINASNRTIKKMQDQLTAFRVLLSSQQRSGPQLSQSTPIASTSRNQNTYQQSSIAAAIPEVEQRATNPFTPPTNTDPRASGPPSPPTNTVPRVSDLFVPPSELNRGAETIAADPLVRRPAPQMPPRPISHTINQLPRNSASVRATTQDTIVSSEVLTYPYTSGHLGPAHLTRPTSSRRVTLQAPGETAFQPYHPQSTAVQTIPTNTDPRFAATTSASTIPQGNGPPVMMPSFYPQYPPWPNPWWLNQSAPSSEIHCYRQTQIQNLPKFDGTRREVWVSLQSIYNHQKASGLKKDELLAQLDGAIQGNARRFIEDKMYCREDPDLIIETLKEQYGDPDVVLDDMVKALAKIKQPIPKEKLLDFALSLKSLVTTATALNRTDYLSQTFVMNHVGSMLRLKDQDWWKHQRKSHPTATLQDLSKYLLVRATDPSTVNAPKTARGHEARVHVHDADTTNETSALKCYLCTDAHRLRQCEKFKTMTPDARFKWIKTTRICSCCLSSTSHNWRECPRKRTCGIGGCRCEHNQWLHIPSTNQQIQQSEVSNQAPAAAPMHLHRGKEGTLYKIVPVRIFDRNQQPVDVYAFLDLGSSRTLIEKELYSKLGLAGTRNTLRMRWTQGIQMEDDDSYTTTIKLSRPGATKKFILSGVSTVNDLNLPIQTCNANQLKRSFKHLEDVPVPSYVKAKPSILIGLPHAKLCVGSRMKSSGEEGPIAMRTPLGWTIFGQLRDDNTEAVFCSFNPPSTNPTDLQLHETVHRYITLDTLGTNPNVDPPTSTNDLRAIRIAEESMNYANGRYEVGLPWTTDTVTMPNNFENAFRRLRGFEKSLAKQPSMLNWVNEHIQAMIQKQYVRKASIDDLDTPEGKFWYLPIFIVVNQNKVPPKPRLVYDAAAITQGTSLNSNLLTGPDLVVPLLNCIGQLRLNKYVVVGDIREMYHQIVMTAPDQQYQRFLWRNGNANQPPTTYILQRMAFGTAPSSFLAQYVKNRHSLRYLTTHPEASKSITKNMYVDDHMQSYKTIDEAVQNTSDVINILDEGGFELREIRSNSTQIIRSLPEGRVSKKNAELELQGDEECIFKILGMSWDPLHDAFTYRINSLAIPQSMIDPDHLPTKRELLRTLMSIFDPLGLAAHIIVRGKIIFQRVWTTHCEWDEPVEADISDEFRDWIKLVQQMAAISIPRQYAVTEISESKIQLQIFCDASDHAMAAVGYFRISYSNQIAMSLVLAKTKVMPVKALSMPRAELNAALLAIRVSTTIQEMHPEISFQAITFWSDSKCVLAWLNSTTMKFRKYEAFRVGEILEASQPNQWRYVPSKLNVADDATKPAPSPIDTSNRWYTGPPFLYMPEYDWPSQTELDTENGFIGLTDKTAEELPVSDPLLRNIDSRYRSKWTTLVRIMAYRLRYLYVKLFKRLTPAPHLTVAEIDAAEKYIFKSIQREVYNAETTALESDQVISKRSSLRSLTPQIGSDGLMRLRSRFQNAKRSYAARNPIILPPKHELVETLVKHYHEKYLHRSEGAVICAIRETIWIPHIKNLVRRTARQCNMCELMRATPRPPQMADLPSFRLDSDHKPFFHTGVDACGPFEVVQGRQTKKRWVLLFCCMVVRAIHVELIEEMTTNRCLLAISDFVNLRGEVGHLYSDCGTNFVGANNKYDELLAELSPRLASESPAKLRIEWHFNPSRAPHWGGAWERLIRTLKNTLKVIVHSTPRRLTHEAFRSALLEVANRINDRPLVHIPMDTEDEPPLTPNHFLFGINNPVKAHGAITDADVCSRMSYRRVQHMVRNLWRRWLTEYTPMMAKREKWQDQVEPMQVGDVVLIAYPEEPRETWKRGIIVATHPGQDEQVRLVTVKEANGKLKRRTVHRLVKLNIRSRCQNPTIDGAESVNPKSAHWDIGPTSREEHDAIQMQQ